MSKTGVSLSEEPLTATDIEHLTPQYLPIKESQAMEYTTESDNLSNAPEYASDGALYNSDFMASDSKEHTPRRLRRKKRRLQSKYELRNRNVQGVLFLEIASCSNLPPIKSFTRATFDMDPFVVVTFGKKTFRTS